VHHGRELGGAQGPRDVVHAGRGGRGAVQGPEAVQLVQAGVQPVVAVVEQLQRGEGPARRREGQRGGRGGSRYERQFLQRTTASLEYL
jgi:hypothetical protein